MDRVRAEVIFNQLFDGVTGFDISLKNRKKRGISDKAFTYGEITFDSLARILDQAGTGRGGAFYDLGSGTGKVVIAAALLGNFDKAIGIELLEDLFQISQEIAEKFRMLTKSSTDITFINSDFMTHDFSDATVIYIASTCFTTEFMDSLAIKLETLPPGSKVITLTKELHSENLTQIHKGAYPMSWGDTTVCIYERNNL